ncbi:ABC transporter ATP-binding protein [Eubacteriales bacterium OttesenSCG-928-K08]|nr:ABC transporter ATP-binding protein [Eubacteriales bacterium OttesenSCG-928-K08]
MNAIEIKGLTKVYSGFKLDELTLTLPSGCIMGLIGENGAGKSTTIKLILNMVKKDAGQVTVLGEDNTICSKENIGVVMDEVGFPECLKVEQVEKIMQGIYRNWDKDAYYKNINRLSVPLNKPFKDFSRGMKMKLGIAVALSHNAKLLILDEATSGLDPVVRDEVLDIFADFTRDEGHSILLSSHIVSDLEKICDYIAFINKGKLMLCEEKDALYEQYGMIHCSPDEFMAIEPSAIKGKKESHYGVEAIVLREAIPGGFNISPINIEELFVFMVKGGR